MKRPFVPMWRQVLVVCSVIAIVIGILLERGTNIYLIGWYLYALGATGIVISFLGGEK